MNNRREEFKKRFDDLLKKYKVTLTAGDHWDGYCGTDLRITAEFEPGDCEDIDLGGHYDGKD